MPEYSVRLEDTVAAGVLGNPKWCMVTVRVKAVSAKHAMAKAVKQLSNATYVAKHAQLVPAKYAQSNYWRRIWARAYNNMPTRVFVAKNETWHKQKHNTVPLPVFIREQAHGRMRQDVRGVIFKQEITRKAHKMGALNCLTKLLQYAKWNKQHSMAHYAVSNAMARGSRPRTPERRELLLKLAGPDGMKIAAEMLDRPFRNLTIKGAK